MSNYPDSPNPYGSPAYGQYGPQYGPAARPAWASRLPTFCIVMFAIDLVFCFLRLVMVVLGVFGLQAGGKDPMLAQTGLLEVATGAAMVLFGLTADVAMLTKQTWGLILAWVKVIATLGSVAVGVWQLSFILERFPPGSAERVGGMVGGGIAVVIRLGLTGLYVLALVMFAKWAQQRAAAGPRPTELY